MDLFKGISLGGIGQEGGRLSRRGFLAGACCVAASPVLTPVTFAAMPGDNRFVTIILRGAMDGLDLVQPYGDPAYAALRPKLGMTPDTGLLDLDGFYGLNPAASALLPLFQAGELAFVHAVSTPYRDQRSHFDGQDILETGGMAKEQKTGWLNRTLASIPRSDSRRAIDINTSMELILTGPNSSDSWSSQSDLALADDEIAFLDRLYAGDPAFAKVMEEAKQTALSAAGAFSGDEKRGAGIADMAQLAGGMLRKDYRIASFSINGWDTHVGQRNQFAKAAGELATAITTLKQALGDAWKNTVVLAMTEFGRTARENGTNGTDHGTGGLAVLAGGAVPGGKVLSRWPGLAEDKLLDQRDLMPTGDIREIAAAMLYKQFNISPNTLTTKVFPGLSFDTSSVYLKG
ncbi:DUF1501 domain-containing protein [Neorhizobium alkalisoli]|uniref:Uncharacterized protein (DUF1501 family) n=1 Tax=Neorhizobium alkalisoli TaxID=528178 RepID=A0A561QHF0_9HYPH|nr:DUF1501 domain-containing protein [Neorhizobium alkalisoli]TWF49787.1 uncharacterized protein (DUF1501 family) [Neorhizobium alkalisoli]